MKAMKQELQDLGVPINLWNCVNFRASVIPPVKGQQITPYALGSVDIIKLTNGDGDKMLAARANAVADAINQRLTRSDEQIQLYDINARLSEDGKTADIRMRNTVIVTLTAADLKRDSLATLPDYATRIKQNLQSAIYNEQQRRGF